MSCGCYYEQLQLVGLIKTPGVGRTITWMWLSCDCALGSHVLCDSGDGVFVSIEYLIARYEVINYVST